MHAFDANDPEPEPPPIDERLVAPGVRYEIEDGKLVYVPPADPPHGTRHSKLAALVEAHAAGEFKVAVDMLTRTSETNDIAPDVSVFPRAPHPETGGRQLEQLAFEVVSTESLSRAGRRAAKLMGRGVRRVFAIDVEDSRVLEWSPSLETWNPLDPEARIEDRALAAPLPIAELVSEARPHDALARALVAQRNPVFEAVRADDRREAKQEGIAEGVARGHTEGVARGHAKGMADALLALLAARSIAVAPADRDRILGETDPERLEEWIARATRCNDIAEMFAER